MTTLSPESFEAAHAASQSESLRVVYIMGYGRSGSTLLDVMLGSHHAITGVGEMSYLSEWIRDNKQCACHSPIRDCDFWAPVVRAYRASLKGEDELPQEVEREVESRRSLPGMIRGRLPDETTLRYRRTQSSIFEAVARVGGNRIIVDSSKSVRRTDGRPLALQRLTDFDVRVIHLVRDGRAVTWSALKGPGASNAEYKRSLPPLLRGLVVIMDWTITNLVCLFLARRLTPGSVLRVRYEDLTRDPESELARIGDFIGVDLATVSRAITQGEPLSPGHNVGGNRLRFASAIRLKEDQEWRERLPRIYRGLYRLMAWPVAGRLGYGLRSR